MTGFWLVETKVLLSYYIIKGFLLIDIGVRSDTRVGKEKLLKELKVAQGKL